MRFVNFFIFTTEICTRIVGNTALNLALGKNAWQSSINHNGSPLLAVDGDSNRDLDQNSCTHTDYQDNPWWIVDLGRIHEITDVSVYNQEDLKPGGSCCSWRLQNFTAEVAVSDPQTHGFDVFQLCAYHPTAAMPSEKVALECTRPVRGRYVKIQVYLPINIKSPSKLALTLCEVEIYSRNTSSRLFTSLKNTRLNAVSVRNVSVTKSTECADYCQGISLCTSFNVLQNGNTVVCELLNEIEEPGQTQQILGWIHFY